MSEARKIRIAFTFDDWSEIADVLSEAARREKRPRLMSHAAAVQRSIGLSATASSSEAEAAEMSRS